MIAASTRTPPRTRAAIRGLRPVKGLRRRTYLYFGRLGQEIDHRFSSPSLHARTRGAARDDAGLRARAAAAPRRRLGGRRLVPQRGVLRAGRAGLAGAQVRRRLGGRRGAQRGARALRVGRRRGGDRRPCAHRDAAGVPLRHRGPEGALAGARPARRADRRAGDHRAGRGVRRRVGAHPRRARGRRLARLGRQDVHHQRRAGRLLRDRGAHRRRRPRRSVVPRARARRGRAGAGAEQARLARVGHRGARVRRGVRAGRAPARRARAAAST